MVLNIKKITFCIVHIFLLILFCHSFFCHIQSNNFFNIFILHSVRLFFSLILLFFSSFLSASIHLASRFQLRSILLLMLILLLLLLSNFKSKYILKQSSHKSYYKVEFVLKQTYIQLLSCCVSFLLLLLFRYNSLYFVFL